MMKTNMFRAIFKKATAVALAAVCVLSLGAGNSVMAEEVRGDGMQAGSYVIPVKSLSCEAPIPAVQEAFQKGFGDDVSVEVNENGNMTATAKCQNMEVELIPGIPFYANVLSIKGGVVKSTKTAYATKNDEDTGDALTVETEVPDEITFPLTLDEKNETVLTITVDFMNELLGTGEDYPINVTLALELEQAKIDRAKELSSLVTECKELNEKDYSKSTWNMLQTAITKAEKLLASDTIATDEKFTTMTKELSDAKTSLKAPREQLCDGTYKVKVELYNATKNQPSMAASSVIKDAKITVENGIATMTILTQPMTLGTITASLQELKIKGVNDQVKLALIASKDADGNPTSFTFDLPHTDDYVDVLVNPHVDMMGNMDIDARLFVDYTTVEKIVTTDDSNGAGNDNGTNNGSNSGADESTQTPSAPSTESASGTTVVTAATLNAIKGQDKNVVFDLPNGLKWIINGKNITGTNLENIDLGVVLKSNAIPEKLVESITGGEKNYLEISLNHDGNFGFEGTLTVPVGSQYAGQYANLYYYNKSTGKMELMGSYLVDENGEADLTFTHASDYVIVLGDAVSVATTAPSPVMGDNNHVALLLLLLLAGIGVIAIALRKRNTAR